MDAVETFFDNIWQVLRELSPWLLLGLTIAGVLHVILPPDFIRRHLGGRGFINVFKAVSVGIPMPLCSCGVIPAALGLKKDGASNGAALGFLISTPQTGVDSILVSAGFLGWPFALFKVIAALVSGMVGGLLVNASESQTADHQPANPTCPHCQKSQPQNATQPQRKWSEIWSFSFGMLFRDIYAWLTIGVLLAAAIKTFIPEGYLAQITWIQGFIGMLLMLALALPMYICSTSSVPLAAALVSAGFSPGAALVLLMAGPTTNAATVGMVHRTFGLKTTAIYLTTVAAMSIVAGTLFDSIINATPMAHTKMMHLPNSLQTAAAAIVTALTLFYAAKNLALKKTYQSRARK